MTMPDRVCVITGGARGLGRACARALAAEGARVALLDVDGDAAAATAQTFADEDLTAVGLGCDVRDAAAITAAFDRVDEELGPVEVLVNNAGLGAVRRTEELSEAEWDNVLDTCLKGTFLCSQAAARRMIPRRRGVIVNMASIMGFASMPTRAAYCSAKAGVIAFTKVTAGEWARHGLRVNAVAPGTVETDAIRDAIEKGLMDPERYVAWVPAGRLGAADEVANAVVYLASEGAAYVTGHTLVVDGGFSAYDAYWEPAGAGDVAG